MVHVVPVLQTAQLVKQGLQDWVTASYHSAPEHWMQLAPPAPKLYPETQDEQTDPEVHVWQLAKQGTQVPELKNVPGPQGEQVPALSTCDG